MEKVGLLDLSRFAKTRIDKSIALGYVPPKLAAPGTRLEVEMLREKVCHKSGEHAPARSEKQPDESVKNQLIIMNLELRMIADYRLING